MDENKTEEATTTPVDRDEQNAPKNAAHLTDEAHAPTHRAVDSDVSDVSEANQSDETSHDRVQMPLHAPGLSDILRKAVVAGLGAAVIGEKSVRHAIRELKPGAKEAIDSAISQAEKGKEEIRRLLNDELKRVGDSPALKREIAKSLSSVAIEMTVKVRLNPDGLGPDITFSQPRICWVKDEENTSETPHQTSKKTDAAQDDSGEQPIESTGDELH